MRHGRNRLSGWGLGAPLFALAVLMWVFSPHLVLCVEAPGHIALELPSAHCCGPVSFGSQSAQPENSLLLSPHDGECTDQFVMLHAVRARAVPVVPYFPAPELASFALAMHVFHTALPCDGPVGGRQASIDFDHPALAVLSTVIIRC
jgi:hypothetical protein